MTRSDAGPKARGIVEYGMDVAAPRMLWAALVRAPIPHGRIVRMELGPARRMPGVVAVVGPDDLRTLLPKGALEAERPVFPLDEIRYQGEPIAAVAAETLEQARRAAAAIVPVVEPLRTDARIEDVFPEWPSAAAAKDPRIVGHVHARHGDVEARFRSADLVHSETYRTSGVHQVALEPHACLAEVRNGKFRVRTSTQTPFGLREDLASILGISESDLVVEGTWVGGGFGGKGAAFLEPYALLLAVASERPVKLSITYAEEFELGRTTLPSIIRLDTAVRGGKIVGRRVRLLLDTGASLPGRDFAVGYSIGFLLGPYRTETYEIEGFAVQTNKPPFGPHRAPFAPQSVFALESHIDGLARRLGVDPIEFRQRQVWREGDRTAYDQPVGPFGLEAGLKAAARTAEVWRKGLPAGHGIGVACGFWSTSVGAGGEARLSLRPDGLSILQGEREIGNGSVVQGLAVVAGRVLGLPLTAIRVEYGDTATAPFDSGVFGSRTLGALGQAVERGARSLASTLAKRVGAKEIQLEIKNGQVLVVGGRRRQKLVDLLTPAERTIGGLVVEGKFYGPEREVDASRVIAGTVYPYQDFTGAVHLAEVEVDRETGHVRVIRYAAFQDVGVAVDPSAVQGQVEGGVVMGLGAALSEEMLWTPEARLANPGLLDYRLPRLRDVPPIHVEIIEGFAGAGPFGAKGIGEPPIIPVPATVANAVADATGTRVFELPLTPERVARALKLL
ncbi:MAG: xanthine dehydrogenase family protein molybdopterin-binding subunit [Thermoplasmata archaeon]|nr:xanthine dehydrogenase family protein molybdopterin-binding subunit [Thermoplasmata archaeon]